MLSNHREVDSANQPSHSDKSVLLWIVTTLLLQSLVWYVLVTAAMIGKFTDSPAAQFLFGEPWRGPVFVALNAAIAIVLPVFLWHRFGVVSDLPRGTALAIGLAACLFLLLVSFTGFVATSMALSRAFG